MFNFHFPLPADRQSNLKSFVKLFNPKTKRLKHVTYKQVKRPQKTRQYFFIRYVSVSWLNKSSPRVSSKAMDQYSPSRRYDRKISFTFIGIQSGSYSITSSLSSADHSHCSYGTIWLISPAQECSVRTRLVLDINCVMLPLGTALCANSALH